MEIAEKVTLLSHQVDSLKEYFGKAEVGNFESIIWEKAIPDLLNAKARNGHLAYPGLQSSEAQKGFTQVLLQAAIAQTKGRIKAIPERDPETKSMNFGALCDACGNRDGTVCKLDEREKVALRQVAQRHPLADIHDLR